MVVVQAKTDQLAKALSPAEGRHAADSASPPGAVLIVAENASASAGGEAAIPLAYFRYLRERGADVYLLVHGRCKPELEALLPDDRERIRYIADTRSQRWLWRLSSRMSPRLAERSCGFLIQFITQLAQRREAQRMVKELNIAVVHQPTPVSPRMPSMMFGLGAPVVIGPMNGGMSFPPAFRSRERALTRWSITLLRHASALLQTLIPGKRSAAVLLVANERTRRALPRSLRHRAIVFCENGVDLQLWRHEGAITSRQQAEDDRALRIAFAGRLVELKGVDLLLEAVARAQRQLGEQCPITLDILGNGEMADDLRRQAEELGLGGTVHFHGWQSQQACAAQLASSDVLAFPSLCECGGAVVLEAMAMGLPVIAAKWGGPADYLDPSCGLLVEPKSREALVAGLEDAIVQLARSPALRRAMGKAGQQKALREYDWNVRIDRIIEVYWRAAQESPAASMAACETLDGLATAPKASRSAA